MLICALEITSYDISHGRKMHICIFYFLFNLWPNVLACAIMRRCESMLPHVFLSIICAGDRATVT